MLSPSANLHLVLSCILENLKKFKIEFFHRWASRFLCNILAHLINLGYLVGFNSIMNEVYSNLVIFLRYQNFKKGTVWAYKLWSTSGRHFFLSTKKLRQILVKQKNHLFVFSTSNGGIQSTSYYTYDNSRTAGILLFSIS